MKPPVIQSERLTLDSLTPDDAALTHEFVADDELQRFIPVPVPYTLAQAEHYVGAYATDAEASETMVLWAVREDGALTGALELRIESAGSGDIGFWVGRPHRGRGIMTEAIGLLVEYAFDPLGFDLQRLTWSAAVQNWGSAKAVARNGFTFEGTRRLGLDIRGQRVDAWVASLLRTDSREPVDGWPL